MDPWNYNSKFKHPKEKYNMQVLISRKQNLQKEKWYDLLVRYRSLQLETLIQSYVHVRLTWFI